jgi:hypothetical protein
MKRLKIGYWPLSNGSNSPGDRRRLVFWANSRGHEIITDTERKVDVIVATENADFNSQYFKNARVPVVFDLVDAYLSPLNAANDFLRGIAKSVSGQISGGIKPFSEHVKEFCISSNVVICSSIEQEKIISPFNRNTHVILDSHEEIPFLNPQDLRTTDSKEKLILWEGQPATIRGVRAISPTLDKITKTNTLRFEFVTDEYYYKFLGKHIKQSTAVILKRDLNEIEARVNIIPWSIENLVKSAEKSAIAMIPINLTVPMQELKPENRLLIMWRLGLPCLTSASPAYSRVMSKAGTTGTCIVDEDWKTNFEKLLNDRSFAYDEVERGQIYLRENHTSSILLNKWDEAIASAVG